MGLMQAFTFNTRREKFKDPRVRRAFNLAMNFEEMNKALFYGLYKRINSYFFGSELASTGLPEGDEKAILESVRDKVPPSVFTTPYANPVNESPEAVRKNLREAVGLLREAGYDLRGGKMVSKATGEPLTVEFLEFQNTFERVILPFSAQLKLIGIDATLRVIDQAQYQNRIRNFDFDITTVELGQVAVARQRAARVLGLGGGRQARFAQPDRDQGSRHRRADREGDLRQGPARR